MNTRRRIAFRHHLDELRLRITWSIGSLIVGSAIAYRQRESILHYLTQPLGQPLYYTSPAGGFDFIIKVCLLVGFVVALPVVIYHTVQFLKPLLDRSSQISTIFFVLSSISLALAGFLIAYYLTLPSALRFLRSFDTKGIQPLISAGDYFTFLSLYVGGFIFIFQLPIIVLLIDQIIPLQPQRLIGYLPIVILLSFIFSAIITPTPDPLNQTIMAIPIVLLYLISVGTIWYKRRRGRPVSDGDQSGSSSAK